MPRVRHQLILAGLGQRLRGKGAAASSSPAPRTAFPVCAKGARAKGRQRWAFSSLPASLPRQCARPALLEPACPAAPHARAACPAAACPAQLAQQRLTREQAAHQQRDPSDVWRSTTRSCCAESWRDLGPTMDRDHAETSAIPSRSGRRRCSTQQHQAARACSGQVATRSAATAAFHCPSQQFSPYFAAHPETGRALPDFSSESIRKKATASEVGARRFM